MSRQPAGTPTDDTVERPSAATAPMPKSYRRTALSTSFSGGPGRTCDVCGFRGFRWQTACPQGHPLA